MAPLGGIVTAAAPRAAVLPVPSIGVNSLGPVALRSGRHLQVRAGAGGSQRGRIAGDPRGGGRTLGRRGADGIQEMSRHGIRSVYPCHDPLQQSPPLQRGKIAHFLEAMWTC